MVSLCHGAIAGIAAYSYAILTVKLVLPTLPAAVLALAAASAFGTAVGWITGRTTGIFFIMATLAFGQMAYTAIFKSRWLGGDDGMGGIARFDLGWIGIDLNDSLVFALYALLLLALVYIAAALIMRSGFGRTLSGIHANEERMQSFGVNTVLHRARALGFSAPSRRCRRHSRRPAHTLHLAAASVLDGLGRGADRRHPGRARHLNRASHRGRAVRSPEATRFRTTPTIGISSSVWF